jgi:virginiamycin B lyase
MNQESPDADLERMLHSYFAQKKRRSADFERFWTAVDAALDARPDVEIETSMHIEAKQCGASGHIKPEPFDLADDDTYAFVLEDTLEVSMTEGHDQREHDQREQEPSTTARSTRWGTRQRGLGPRGTAIAGIAAALILVIIAATIFAQIAVRRTPHPAATTTPTTLSKIVLPNANTRQINQLITAPDGSLWFADSFTHTAKISHMAPDGTISEFPVPANDKVKDVYIYGLAIGPEGAIWFDGDNFDGSVYTTFVSLMTPNGVFTTIPVPAGLHPDFLFSGPDGGLWFSGERDLNPAAPPPKSYEGVIGRISADGKITEESPGVVNGVCIGPDKAIWYTLTVATDLSHLTGRIVRMSLSGQTQAFPVPYAPNSIASGSDGALWYSELVPNPDQQSPALPRKGYIGRMTTAGVASDLPIDPTLGVDKLVTGSDGAIWFTTAQDETGKFGRIMPNGDVKTFTTGGNSGIVLVAAAPGALWLLDARNNLWRYRLSA